MADDIDTGPIDTGPAPAPSQPLPRVVEVPDEKSRDQLVREQFNAGLALNAHATEDATDYVRERETQDKFLEGEDLSPAAYARMASAHTQRIATGHRRTSTCTW